MNKLIDHKLYSVSSLFIKFYLISMIFVIHFKGISEMFNEI